VTNHSYSEKASLSLLLVLLLFICLPTIIVLHSSSELKLY